MGRLPRITRLESCIWVINPSLSDLQASAPSRSFSVGASWHFLEQDISLCMAGIYTTETQHPQPCPLCDIEYWFLAYPQMPHRSPGRWFPDCALLRTHLLAGFFLLPWWGIGGASGPLWMLICKGPWLWVSMSLEPEVGSDSLSMNWWATHCPTWSHIWSLFAVLEFPDGLLTQSRVGGGVAGSHWSARTAPNPTPCPERCSQSSSRIQPLPLERNRLRFRHLGSAFPAVGSRMPAELSSLLGIAGSSYPARRSSPTQGGGSARE